MKFQLLPFEPFHPDQDDYQVSGQMIFDQHQVELIFKVRGKVEHLQWNASLHGRQDQLWMDTCFELFARPVSQKNYVEFNLSPSGAWNAYDFLDYRQLQGPLKCKVPKVHLINAPGQIELRSKIDLPLMANTYDLFPTCVLKNQFGTYYFALQHMGPKPDFHLFPPGLTARP